MIPGMKAAAVFWLAFELVSAIPVVCQTPAQVDLSDHVETLSRISSVSFTFSGREGGKMASVSRDSSGRVLSTYQGGKIHFVIKNSSGHAITAYDVLLVPKGVKKKNEHYLCRSECSGHAQIGSIEQPAIANGATKEEWYPAEDWEGGTAVLEAVVFDDGSYDGGERAAAFLVAKQLGNQAEYDRILAAAEPIVMATGPQMTEKGTQIDSTLAALQVEPDEEQLDNFSRWFPNVRDCDHHFPQIMQNASTEAITTVRNSLQAFLSAPTAHTETALNQWWEPEKHQLGALGCSSCGDKLATPTPPVRTKTLSVGCKAPPIPGGTNGAVVQLAEDDSASDDDDSGDDADQTADSAVPGQPLADLSQANAQQGSATSAANPDGASTPSTNASDEAGQSEQTSTSSRCLPMVPGRLGFAGPGVAGASTDPSAPRPVSDAQLYPRYLRYVEEWDRCLADGEWPESTMERFRDPYPERMNDDQREIVRLIAADWVQWQRENRPAASLLNPQSAVEATTSASDTSSQPSRPPILAPQRVGAPQTWAQAQQMLQRRQQLVDQRNERNRIIDSRVQSMKLALGKTSFVALDDYAHQLYNTVPGRVVRQPLSENAMYSRYLRLIGTMDKFASNEDEDGRAAAKARAEEQAARGLNNADERIVEQEADTLRDLNQRRRVAIVEGETSVPATMPLTRPASGAPAMGLLVERLQSNMSKGGFEALQNRVHELYDSEGVDRVVALDAPDPQSPRQAEAEPSGPH